MRKQSVGVQPSGCPSIASARWSTGFSLPKRCPALRCGRSPDRATTTRPQVSPNVAELTSAQLSKLPLRRTLELLDPCPQTLRKHRYLICKSSNSCSRPPIPKSRFIPSSVPNHPSRATFRGPPKPPIPLACMPRAGALPSGHAAHVRGPMSSLEIRSVR